MSSSEHPAATPAAAATAASSGVYAAQPAFPLLASSLLSRYCHHQNYHNRNHHQEDDQKEQNDHDNATATIPATNDAKPTTAWNLMTDFEKGVRTRDDSDSCSHIFRCGTTIGFSWLKKEGWWNARGLRSVEQEDQCRERVGELPRRLLASLLLRSKESSRSSPQPKAFIIHPSNSSTFAPETLLQDVLSLDRRHHEPAVSSLLSRDEAITLLDAVQLLAVYDFPSAVQAISQVSDALHELQQGRRKHPSGEEQEEEEDEPILLIVEGLDALTESVIRTSNPLRGSALLMPALRTLTHLSRAYASFLSVLLVNTLGLGGTTSAGAYQKPASADNTPQSVPITVTEDRTRASILNPDDGGLQSIFFRSASASAGSWSRAGAGTGSLLPTLLSRTLDQGIDSHLLLSSVKGKSVVEVIKDRTGDGVGKWCVWG
ncbi:hypothetical protein VTN96DRAFT_6663 [Rasamsonia emersonii]